MLKPAGSLLLFLVAGVLGFWPQSAAFAAGQVRKAPDPAWVDDTPVPAPRAARLREVKDGLYYLLYDTQVRTEGAGDSTYFRTVYKVTDREGLEDAARVEAEFDPSDQDMVFHHIRILRDGVASDRLKDAKIELLRREEDLDDGVVDGRQTAHLEIKDVEVGDIVDIAYSWQTRSKLWPGEFFDNFQTSWSMPMALTRYRLLWPAGRPLAIRDRNTNLAATRTRLGDRIVYEWQVRDPDPVREEDDAPSWYSQWGEVSLSSMTSWADVVAWALPLYSGKDALPPSLAARVDRIAQTYKNPEDRITEALRLVQDDLRYVSVSIGNGSFVPRSASEVMRSGYGDCKDKSQLLVAVLHRLGVKAYVALTHSQQGRVLPEQAPSPTAFDHAIVEVKLGTHSYWLDPTGANEGGRFPDVEQADYDWALPVAPGQTALERIPESSPAAPTYRTVERYEVPDAPTRPITLNVTTVYTGADADWMRNDVASKSEAQVESDYLDYYDDLYPGIVRDAPVRFIDDRRDNRFSVYETYSLSHATLSKDALEKKFPVKAGSLDVYDTPKAGRRAPYKLEFPVNKEHMIVVVTPGHRPPAPNPVSFVGTAFRYSLHAARKGDALMLDYRLVGTKDVLAPAESAAFEKEVDDIKTDNYAELDLTSAAGATSLGKSRDERIFIWIAMAVGLGATMIYGIRAALLAARA